MYARRIVLKCAAAIPITVVLADPMLAWAPWAMGRNTLHPLKVYFWRETMSEEEWEHQYCS